MKKDRACCESVFMRQLREFNDGTRNSPPEKTSWMIETEAFLSSTELGSDPPESRVDSLEEAQAEWYVWERFYSRDHPMAAPVKRYESLELASKIVGAAGEGRDYESIQSVLDSAESPVDGLTLAFVVVLARLTTVRDRARKAAQAKNAGARAWILEQWNLHGAQYESKRRFAVAYSPILKREGRTKTDISIDTIERNWLPKIV